jgi:putative FmdB family regulatory protein
MPIYEYQAKAPPAGCEQCRERFEIRQSIHDEPLTRCPNCGRPIERLISRCGISTQTREKSVLSDKNLKRHGFTKLVNEGGGKFRKTT